MFLPLHVLDNGDQNQPPPPQKKNPAQEHISAPIKAIGEGCDGVSHAAQDEMVRRVDVRLCVQLSSLS